MVSTCVKTTNIIRLTKVRVPQFMSMIINPLKNTSVMRIGTTLKKTISQPFLGKKSWLPAKIKNVQPCWSTWYISVVFCWLGGVICRSQAGVASGRPQNSSEPHNSSFWKSTLSHLALLLKEYTSNPKASCQPIRRIRRELTGLSTFRSVVDLPVISGS